MSHLSPKHSEEQSPSTAIDYPPNPDETQEIVGSEPTKFPDYPSESVTHYSSSLPHNTAVQWLVPAEAVSPKRWPAGWALVKAAEERVEASETPWVDPVLEALANSKRGDVEKAIAKDIGRGDNLRSESPIETPYYQIMKERRSRLGLKAAGVLTSLLVGGGITLFMGAVKYDMGERHGIQADPVIPGNSIAFNEYGVPGYANKDEKTGEVKVDSSVVPILLGASGILGLQIMLGGMGTSESPNGARKTARKKLEKQKKDLQ